MKNKKISKYSQSIKLVNQIQKIRSKNIPYYSICKWQSRTCNTQPTKYLHNPLEKAWKSFNNCEKLSCRDLIEINQHFQFSLPNNKLSTESKYHIFGGGDRQKYFCDMLTFSSSV